MLSIVETEKTVEQATASAVEAVKRHGFGVLTVYDLQAKMAEKGVAFPEEVRILEVCNPRYAAEVLKNDITMAVALPCRIAVYSEAGRTKIGTLRPTALLANFPNSAASEPVARKVEEELLAMIRESA